jgi:RHS repeat-associated protein
VLGVYQPGTVYQIIRYSPFGQQTALTGSVGDTNRLRWRGLMWESDSTQLYYMRGRWYDPNTGRFMSQDPIGLAGGINQYAFASSDYINGSDPSGLLCDDDIVNGFCGDDGSGGGPGGMLTGTMVTWNVTAPPCNSGPPACLYGPSDWVAFFNALGASFGQPMAGTLGGPLIPSSGGSGGNASSGNQPGRSRPSGYTRDMEDCVRDAGIAALPAAVWGMGTGALAGARVGFAPSLRSAAIMGLAAGAVTVEAGGSGLVPTAATTFIFSELKYIGAGAVIGFSVPIIGAEAVALSPVGCVASAR